MSGVIRSWQCQNSRCQKAFDSWEPNPACPSCKCVRVGWIPGGGHIAGTVKAADAELRALADVFRMTDMHSAQEGRGAKKVAQQPQTSGQVHTFAGGFAANINPSAGAQCVPTANNFNVKVHATPGNALGPGALGLPSVRTNTAIQATHKP